MNSKEKKDPRNRRITVRGKRYSLEFVKLKHYGQADPPSNPGKKVLIKRSMKGKEMLGTLIHELQHLCHWDIDESVIAEVEQDITRILWDLGYRAPWDHPKQDLPS